MRSRRSRRFRGYRAIANSVEAIATALFASGIETWWANWEIKAGDSLRQKIDEGLKLHGLYRAPHAGVDQEALGESRAWVNQEMDAGLIRKIEERARFIPLRKDLPTKELPPLLRGMLSPELQDFEADIKRLVGDILEVSRKPPLGPAPLTTEREANTGHSAAATAVAKLFVERTKNALLFDPVITLQELSERTSLSDDDLTDAMYELRNMVEDHQGSIASLPELYVTFDKYFKDWDPAVDGLRLAADFVNDSSFPGEPDKIAGRAIMGSSGTISRKAVAGSGQEEVVINHGSAATRPPRLVPRWALHRRAYRDQPEHNGTLDVAPARRPEALPLFGERYIADARQVFTRWPLAGVSVV